MENPLLVRAAMRNRTYLAVLLPLLLFAGTLGAGKAAGPAQGTIVSVDPGKMTLTVTVEKRPIVYTITRETSF